MMRRLALLPILAAPLAAAPVDFAHEVVPLLRKHCIECHTGAKKKGGLSMNTRADLLAGSENGPVVVPGKSGESLLLKVVRSDDPDTRMPPKGAALSAEESAVLARWIDEGLTWQEGFSFQPAAWEPPLRPHRPELPAARDGRTHPVDRLLDAWMAEKGVARPGPVEDAVFLRRVSLDLVGQLPDPEQTRAFVADGRPDKRERLIDSLLADSEAYAAHWLSFWNDLLRNDYAGTGYIDGGRRQITEWLHESLVTNKPYDAFARELIAPTPESEGLARGIKWRGAVSAGQIVPIQYAQSVGQVFLGINLKCASCHDSFVDRWKLTDAYGLAAVYADEPLELHRCDVPTGRKAQPAWLFPELGQIDASKPRAERLRELAALMTHKENGRFTRTIVNRMWHRLTGAGIVHPVDAMQSPPWHAGLLDWLASEFAAGGHDLKQLLKLICTSQAYQSKSAVLEEGSSPEWRGPRARRMTAEQFVDAVWQITGTAPAKADAGVRKSGPAPAAAGPDARWIWSTDGAAVPHAAGERVALRRRITLKATPAQTTGVATCDNGFRLFVNGRPVAAGDNWEAPVALSEAAWRAGENEIVAVAENGGSGPNPAGFYLELRLVSKDGTTTVRSDRQWEWTRTMPDGSGRWASAPTDWKPAAEVKAQQTWDRVKPELAAALQGGGGVRVRASLMKSDLLMRALGRPNREQIVSTRPAELTTLEAMDLNNGPILASLLERGATRLLARQAWTGETLTEWLYAAALCRPPTADERAAAMEVLGAKPDPATVQDLLWAVFMLPEFLLVR